MTNSPGARGDRRTWPLRAYFAALVALFVTAAVAGAVFVRLQAKGDARRGAEMDASFAAEKAAGPVAEGINFLRPALQAVAADPTSSQLLAQPEACNLSFAKVGAFPTGHIDVLRSDGSIVSSSRPGPPATLSDYAGAAWLDQANAGSVLSAPVTDAATSRPAVLIAEPFSGGMAVAFLDLDPLGPELASEFGGRRGLEFLVTSPDGATILARSVDPARWVGQPLASTSFDPDESEQDVDGTPRLYGAATVPDIGWHVYAGADRAAALASADRLGNRGLMIIGFGLLVIMIAAFVVERRIASPIRKLSGTVKDARGGAGPSGPLAPSGPAEVMTLADDFEGLMAAVDRELVERRRAEEAARASERTYRLMFEDNPQPMWIYDADTLEFLEVNDAAVAHYGYSREEFLAMSVNDLRHPDQAETVPAGPVAEAMARWPERHVKKNGTAVHVETTFHSVAFGERRGRFVIAQDVTERERVQRQMYQKQRLESLGELAGGVAHDFNNLLAVIMNYAAFVRKDVRRSDPASDPARWDRIDDDLEQIEHASERGARLTHQLLAFARSEAIRTEALDVNEVLEGLEQLLRRTIGEHVELVYRLGQVRPVVADRGQLEQVLVNLAVNARDAMPAGGTVSVQTDTIDVDEEYAAVREGLVPGDYVRIRVSDTGVGMDETVVQHAFEPFYTTKPKGEGTGLGLATVHGIVAQAGGHASIYSEPGVGTTFTALFPAVLDDRPEAEPRPARVRRTGRGERVLVVDDEPAIREVARRILEQNGYRVVTAPDGAAAIAIAEHDDDPFDLLLTDVVMPHMSGPELAERLTVSPGPRVLFMSGYAAPVLASTGAVDPGLTLIDKPFSEYALLDSVRDVLDRE